MVDPKTSATKAFLTIRDNGGGWPNPAVSAMVGQIACIYATSGYDSVVHLADEVDNAALTIPRGMVWAFFLSFPMSMIMLVTYCMNVGSMDDALSGRYPPFVAVFENALHNTAAVTAFTSIILALLVMITISALAATSRQTYAFARDRGLPFSKDLGQLTSSSKIPANAIFATACTTGILSLIQLGTEPTTNSTLALSCAALMATSTLSISTLTYHRLNHQGLPRAQWSLGRYGLLINCCALLYTSWALFWSLWPSRYHITAATFNWAPVILLGVLGLAAVLYHFDGRKRYVEPAITEVEGRVLW